MHRSSAISPDYSDYKFKCELDFIEVRVHLQRTTNFQTVRRLSKATFVKAIDKGPGDESNTFELKFNDPGRWSTVTAAVQALEEVHGCRSPAIVVTMEVSFDAYSRSQDLQSLVNIAGRFLQWSTINLSANVRSASTPGSAASVEVSHTQNLKKLAQGETFYEGDKTDDVTRRTYVKTTDGAGTNAEGTPIKLPLDQWRARTEVTLRGASLPALLLSEAATQFKFTELARFFKFRCLSAEAQKNPIQLLVAGRAPILGARAPRKDRRLFGSNTVGDRHLSSKSYECLRQLTDRLRYSPALRRRTKLNQTESRQAV